MALDTDKIIEELKGASILELNDLVKAIEDEFDVTAAAPVAAAGAGDAAAAKSEFDVELTDARLRLSRKSVTSLARAYLMLRSWLTVLQLSLRKALQKTTQTRSRNNLKALAQL